MNKVLSCFLLTVVPILSSAENILYEETIYNLPNRGVETEVYLGDRMVSQQKGEWRECITPKRTFTKKSMGWTYSYRGGEPVCKVDLKSKYYSPTYDNGEGFGNKTRQAVRWKKKGNKSSLCQCAGICAACVKKLSEDDVEDGETFIYAKNSFQQTIEYAGRSGDVLKFNYSEFSDGWARQAFSREFQVDLNEGNVAAFKGAVLEIIEATNVQIKYKVIRNFASDI